MVGSRITLTPFDGTKKLDWLGADIHGFVMTCVVGFVLSMLLTTALSALTSINQYIPAQQVFVAALVLAGIISFILVFPLRINITVIGQRRQFTYLCRWL